jgi:hypothetical protein
VSSEVYDTLVATAKRLNMRLVGHVIPDYGLNRAIAAHQQVEHMDGYMAAIAPKEVASTFPAGSSSSATSSMRSAECDARARAAPQAGGIWTSPTLVVRDGGFRKGADAYLQWPELRYASAQRSRLTRTR